MSDFFKKYGQVLGISALINVLVTAIVAVLVVQLLVPQVAPGTEIRPLISGSSADEEKIVKMVEHTSPAVVSIVITKDVPVLQQRFGGNDFFRQFFGYDPFGGNFQQVPNQPQTERREIGGGSGFLVSGDGLVVTNKHVVADPAAEYTIFTNDGEKYTAKVVAKDTSLDLALLRISGGTNFPFLAFGDSSALKAGQTVIAIGNALGEFRNSVSVGVISGLARSIIAGDEFGSAEQLDEVIQTDAAINPGNSGGPLLNLNGEVIGVNVAVVQGSENIGFALPADSVKGAVESVRLHGEIIRPYIGVRYVLINEQIQEKNNLSVDYGALVVRGDAPEELAVIPGSPADKAGIVENDIILQMEGVKIDKEHTLASIIRKKNIGDAITLTILSKGAKKQVRVILEKAPR